MPMSPERILSGLFINPDFDGSKAVITINVPKGCSQIRWKITAGRKKIGAGRVSGPKRKAGFECPIPHFQPWTPDTPFLYRLTLSFAAPGDECTVSHNFGMRKFHVADNRIYLNNKPFYTRGIIRGREAHDHQNLCGLSEAEYYEKNILAAKRFGFNFVRFHSKVPPKAYLDAADRLGVLTHVEVRKYYGKYQAERDLLDHDPMLVKSALCQSEIKRIRNHASLMVYCLGNEINQPGRNPEVAERAAQLHKLDPTRLFIDTCARGEFDRDNVDLDVQHMGYFAPFGRNYNMFDTTENWAIFGSCKGVKMKTGKPGSVTRREVPLNRPVVAHEVCHYLGLRDIDELEKKFTKYTVEKPWWLDELKKLRKKKNLDRDYRKLLEASGRFQFIWHKQALESVRKSPILVGLHFLQLADTERYENSNGLVDLFDDPKKSIRPEDYQAFNSETVVVADLPRRTFFEGESITVPVWLSNFSQDFYGDATLSWELTVGKKRITCRLAKLDILGGLNRIANIEIDLPKCARAASMKLSIRLKQSGGRTIVNSWPLWVYPNRPEALPLKKVTAGLADIELHKRYPKLAISTNLKRPEKLIITDHFTPDVFRHLAKGGDVLMLYRVGETRRDPGAKPEGYYMPATWDRFKPVIWDRGHNLGGFLRKHPATKGFPTDGFLDFQFAGIIDDCDKMCLDDFPAAVDPIIQWVDKAVRDRYDVFTFNLPELQPEWTMRKFAYLFDLRVGKGRLMMSGFNLTGIEHDVPEAVAMFESLVACVTSRIWKPKASIGADQLKKYLARKGRSPRTKERMMTQYWQFDSEPLESAQYWKDAEEWIRNG